MFAAEPHETRSAPGLAALALFLMVLLGTPAHNAIAETLPLERLGHIHGIAVDPDDASQLYLATHDGLFLASPRGVATRIGTSRDDLTSFAVDPSNPDVFYASGHPPEGGGNLGFLVSRDRGRTWQRLSRGAGRLADFHALAISPRDPRVLYGVYEGLQVSRDGGRTWRLAGKAPERTFMLAAGSEGPDSLWAAAVNGLFFTRDGGRNWRRAFMESRPVTLVAVSAAGRIYAFVYGAGLMMRDGPGAGWHVMSSAFGKRYPVALAIDPADPDRIHVAADTGAIVTGRRAGREWVSYRGHDRETPEAVAAARETYRQYCQACHGENGVGERPGNPQARDEYGFTAPALDDSAHGWHHSDDDLAAIVLDGSPRNPRMLPFRNVMPEDQAVATVAYIKSLWSFSSLACQGALHMKCMH